MITLELTEDEAQMILNALVKEPYLQVYELIENIQKQSDEILSGGLFLSQVLLKVWLILFGSISIRKEHLRRYDDE